ncbi:unnamed protein product [Kluyveromyces dobzhanskii CBS 2104]|uniref:WGS project CCBQ000000000 data, contig 00099 n=1 Tax=Kluyveromyces dobzhanskii CBS 2104 TaxID=1427455 RepID=A0A0A8L4Q1_9SACH|nr:unnamed protein product [Kluyveromyces dobzhanskii CBS 2104]
MANKVTKESSGSIYRSVAACKRCRVRKIKCDNKFPSCTKCIQAQEPCITIDPSTRREIPRSYVVYLEDKVLALKELLEKNSIDPEEADGNIPATSSDKACNIGLFEERENLRGKHKLPNGNEMAGFIVNRGTSMLNGIVDNVRDLKDASDQFAKVGIVKQKMELENDLEELSTSYLGDSSGISFAKMMFTAVKFRPDVLPRDKKVSAGNSAHKVPKFTKKHSFKIPPKLKAESLIADYFTASNSQLPILHRELFLQKYFRPIYGSLSPHVSWASDHSKINDSFQIPEMFNPPIFKQTLESYLEDHPDAEKIPSEYHQPLFFLNIVFAIGISTKILTDDGMDHRLFKFCADQYQDSLYTSKTNRLEALQGLLLIAVYSLMRPTMPGLWYTLGSAVRLCVDLGLHAEKLNKNYDPFLRDIRRRLFWCCYSMDRQVCAYFGRPVSIPDVNVTAMFPSALDDALITTAEDNVRDYSSPSLVNSDPTYKSVCLSMFQIRKIQSDIVQRMYAPNATIPDEFLDLEDWRISILNQLDVWFQRIIPKTSLQMNCSFPLDFFALNYHYTKHILYGLSPKCPTLNNAGFIVVYESSMDIANINYKLTIEKKLNYTWVAIHNVFMCGMTYLYVIYHTKQFDNAIPVKFEEICNKILFVLVSLFDKCSAADNCHKIFKVMSSVVLKLKMEAMGKEFIADNSQVQVQPETPLNFLGNDSLQEFFDEMNRNPISTETVPSQVSPASSTLSTGQQRGSQRDGTRFFEMIQQLGGESIWGEFFSNSNTF